MRAISDKIVKKVINNTKKIGTDLREFPGTKDGNYLHDREKCLPLNHIFNWTQSFPIGIALWAYTDSKDKIFLDWALQFKQEYYDKVYKTPKDTMHDNGFLYSTYAVMLYQLTHDEEYKNIAIKAADVLAMRYDPRGGYIRAWGRMDDIVPAYVDEELRKNHFFTESNGLAIIDCMMNLPLLFWASEVTGHPYYKRIAMMHADTTIKYFVREDSSVMHAYRFSEETGEAIGEENYCGYSKGSHWARGTSWAIYGFAIAYRYTHKKEYIDTAVLLLDKFMDECKGKIPVWDFRLPLEEEQAIDTSAAAIAICGIIEIQKVNDDKRFQEYKQSLRNSLREYINYDENVMGILMEQNGKHEFTLYGDYFLVESLMKEASELVVW